MTVSATRPATPPAILVADDDDTVRASVSDILRLEGYVVAEADDTDAALNLLGTERFDALVLDDALRQLDGLEFLTAVADAPPAVIMSAHDVDATDRKDLAVRGIAYLHKPVDPEHLLDAVATAVGRSRHH
jgi:DNA-binding response OmpR family regulator